MGLIRVDGDAVCFSLEDQSQPGGKVPGETRIPAGTYKILVRKHGGYHSRCSRRFPAMHKGMLELAEVPGFTDILIHPGNTDDDTAGCILPGIGASLAGRYSVQQSVTAYCRLYELVIMAAHLGELEIHVTN